VTHWVIALAILGFAAMMLSEERQRSLFGFVLVLLAVSIQLAIVLGKVPG
jgi:hypothetical protein